MESLINFFTPAYQSFCNFLFGGDITGILALKLGVPWYRVHEHIIAWLIILLIVVVIVEEVRIRRMRNKCG